MKGKVVSWMSDSLLKREWKFMVWCDEW